MKSLSQAADLRLPLRLAFSVVLARAKLSAILRSKARFRAAVRSRTRLASSLNPTSSTQCSPFSIAQWLRMAEASCAGGGLVARIGGAGLGGDPRDKKLGPARQKPREGGPQGTPS